MMRTFLTLLLALSLPAWADQNHECQGGHNCNDGGGVPDVVDVDVPVDVSVPVDVDVPVTVPVDASTSVETPVSVVNQQGVNIENQRQAPGIGLSTPSGSTGVGVTTPWGGLMVNLPWSWGDRKVIPICDRLWFNGETIQAERCICLTSVMKKLHKTPELCEQSLGGGSGGGKTETPPTEVVLPAGMLLVAEVDMEELKRDHEATQEEITETKAELKAVRKELDKYGNTRLDVLKEIDRREEEQQQGLEEFLKQLEKRGEDDG